MYKNRIKLMTGKKKGKSVAPPGSNWGPRIALAEKEKARSISLPDTGNLTTITNQIKGGGDGDSKIGLIPTYARKQNSYINNPPLPSGRPLQKNNGNPPLPPPPTGSHCPRTNHKKMSMSSTASTISGTYSGGNNYIYNYARRASSVGCGQKSFFLAHPQDPHRHHTSSRSSQSEQTSGSSNKTDGYVGGSTYMLGGSSSGSHVTLSTVGETMSQPLTLIIPPVSSVERLNGDYEDDNGLYNIMMERDQDSFPSTKTYCSSREDEDEEGESSGNNVQCQNTASHTKPLTKQRKEENQTLKTVHENPYSSCRDPLPSKSEHLFANPAVNLGILKVSTTQPIIHCHYNESHSKNKRVTATNRGVGEDGQNVDLLSKDKRLLHTNIRQGSNPPHGPIENNKVERKEYDEHEFGRHKTLKNDIQFQSARISDLKNICYSNNKNNSIGSTISSLAAGITMVYVPMESLPRSKSAAVLNASLEFDPDLSKLVEEAQTEGKNSETKEKKTIDHSPTSTITSEEQNDPDNDSLLESFDSVMFKPRDEVHNNHALVPPSPSLSTGSSSSGNLSATPSQPHSPNVTITNINCGCDHATSQNYQNRKPPINEKTINLLKQCVIVSPIVATQTQTTKKQPPPLPPKNASMFKLKPKLKFNDNMFAKIAKRNNHSFTPCKVDSSSEPQTPPTASQREINIRNAVENLESIIRPQSTSPQPTPQKHLSSVSEFKHHRQQNNQDELLGEHKSSTKRVTLTLPNDECLVRDEQLLLLNNLRADTDTEIDAYCSTFLTCGHVLKEDNYSTLSSTHSPRAKLSPNTDSSANDEEVNIAHAYCDKQPSSSEISPPLTSSSNHSPSSEEHEKNRSVLQQLRELSILIGSGGDVCEGSGSYGKQQNKIHTANSFRLHEEDPTRKLSDASADSGKGSVSASAASTTTGSPKSFQSSPDSLQEVESNLHVTPSNQPIMKTCPGANSSSSPCVFRSDCNECLMFNKPLDGFIKPNQSSEICGKSSNQKLSGKKAASKKSSPSKLILRRKSSKSSKSSSKSGVRPSRKKSKHLILEYCDCSSCGRLEGGGSRPQSRPPQPPPRPNFTSTASCPSGDENTRKISTASSSSVVSSTAGVKLSRSVAFRNSSRSNLPRNHTTNKSSPVSSGDPTTGTSGLFTIEEEENYSQSVDSKLRNGIVKSCQNVNTAFENVKRGDIDVKNGSPHWHPDCWLAADPLMSGWSDLESLYSLNVKNNETPLSINGECWTCWAEISEIKRNSENPNGTVDKTKRMFIWLNKRHKDFQAPWWEAKKQASIRWLMTKALIHVPKEYLIDPFKESKKSRPIKYRLRDEVIKGLVGGKLYSLAVSNLYQETLGGNGNPGHGLCHWEIIKILSRRGVYVAQPSDMKLTEGTLRQKPIKIAAHIAMIEAIMNLYSKEILDRERIIATLYTFGATVKPACEEKHIIAWINAAVMTLKSYIVSTRNHQLSPEEQSRWLQLPKFGEIRDLCDGIGICSLFAMYCSNDLKPQDISVPEPGETLTIYDSISNHTLAQKLCEELFPEKIYHLCVTDLLYIHGYMKQNVLCFLVDLFIHLEVNPVVRVNRLTHVPIRVDLI